MNRIFLKSASRAWQWVAVCGRLSLPGAHNKIAHFPLTVRGSFIVHLEGIGRLALVAKTFRAGLLLEHGDAAEGHRSIFPPIAGEQPCIAEIVLDDRNQGAGGLVDSPGGESFKRAGWPIGVTVKEPLAVQLRSETKIGLNFLAGRELAGATPVSAEELDHGGIGRWLLREAADGAGDHKAEQDEFHGSSKIVGRGVSKIVSAPF